MRVVKLRSFMLILICLTPKVEGDDKNLTTLLLAIMSALYHIGHNHIGHEVYKVGSVVWCFCLYLS